jgi:Ca2+-binding RTX toxin-like protein
MGKPVKPPTPTPITYTLSGTSGADTLEALGGQLKLNGVQKIPTAGATQITLNAGDGNDTVRIDALHAFGGVPIIYDGGAGSDTIDFSQSSQAIGVNLFQSGKHTITPQSIITDFTLALNSALYPEYYVSVDPTKTLIKDSSTISTSNLLNFENVIGSAHDDWIYLAHTDLRTTTTLTADGGAGNDYIPGWAGPDVLIGGSGDDFLFGKGGNDTYAGGTGADQFLVLTGNGIDVVTDFNFGEGDQLFIGQLQATDTVPTAASWYATTWTDAQGTIHSAIRADFTGGSVILADHTMLEVAAVMAATTIFDPLI